MFFHPLHMPHHPPQTVICRDLWMDSPAQGSWSSGCLIKVALFFLPLWLPERCHSHPQLQSGAGVDASRSVPPPTALPWPLSPSLTHDVTSFFNVLENTSSSLRPQPVAQARPRGVSPLPPPNPEDEVKCKFSIAQP